MRTYCDFTSQHSMIDNSCRMRARKRLIKYRIVHGLRSVHQCIAFASSDVETSRAGKSFSSFAYTTIDGATTYTLRSVQLATRHREQHPQQDLDTNTAPNSITNVYTLYDESSPSSSSSSSLQPSSYSSAIVANPSQSVSLSSTPNILLAFLSNSLIRSATSVEHCREVLTANFSSRFWNRKIEG